MSASIIAPPSARRNRHMLLEGGCNFRDIGGYGAAGGSTVRWGKVFRTGVLTYLTSNDEAALRALGIRAICDLRRSDERQREATRWCDPTTQGLFWDDGIDMPTIRRFAADHPNTAAGMRAAMIDLYRALPRWMGPRIRGLFECIAEERTPLIVHCAAGKDRTGIAVAVLLASLGVSRADVLQDYLLTNEAGNFERFIVEQRDTHLGLADAHSPLLSMPAEVRHVLFSADADFLDAALAHIIADFGDIDTYLADVAQLDAGSLRRVREQLVE